MVYRHISDELKEMALSMSLQGLSDHDIRDFTGISERSLKRVRSTFRDTGQVSRVPLATGRNRMLTPMEAKVLCFILLTGVIDLLILVSLSLCRAPARHGP